MNWDGKHPPSTGDDHADRHKLRQIRKHGVTRHIILVRHGQYDETHKVRYRRFPSTGKQLPTHSPHSLTFVNTGRRETRLDGTGSTAGRLNGPTVGGLVGRRRSSETRPSFQHDQGQGNGCHYHHLLARFGHGKPGSSIERRKVRTTMVYRA